MYFERRGLFSPEDASDAHQEARLKLLEKSDQIIRMYRGSAAFSSYISSIIMNHCRVMLRESRMRGLGYDYLTDLADSSFEPIPKKLLLDEFRKLDLFFGLMKRRREQFILCLKLMYRIPLLQADIRGFFPGADEKEITALLDLNGHWNVKLKDKDLFAFLAPFITRKTGKEKSPDAVRRWVDLKTWEMISHMNGDPPEARYNRESIQILVEKYFMEYKHNRSFINRAMG
jgi:hypothetical protein